VPDVPRGLHCHRIAGLHLLVAKRFLEFLLNLQEREEDFSPEDLAEIKEGFAQIRRGEYVAWEDFKQRHGL